MMWYRRVLARAAVVSLVLLVSSWVRVAVAQTSGVFVRNGDHLLDDIASNIHTWRLDTRARELLKLAGDRVYTPTIAPARSCAVVSDSQELLSTNYTSEIDEQHDIVIRAGEWYPYIINTYTDENGHMAFRWMRGSYWTWIGWRQDYYVYPTPCGLKSIYKVYKTTIDSQNSVIITTISSNVGLVDCLVDFMLDNPDVRVAIITPSVVLRTMFEVRSVSSNRLASLEPVSLGAVSATGLCQTVKVYGAYTQSLSVYDDLPEDGGGLLSDKPNYLWLTTRRDLFDIVGNNFHLTLRDECPEFADFSWLEAPGMSIGTYLAPFQVPRDKIYDTCAVVGDAPYIRTQGLGAEIDAHDAVMRLNLHLPKEGDYEHYGNKTTHMKTTIRRGVPPEIRLITGYWPDEMMIFYYQKMKGRSLGLSYFPGSGFVAFMYMYKHCHKVDVYGMSTGVPVLHPHNFLLDIILMRYTEQLLNIDNPLGTAVVNVRDSREIRCIVNNWVNRWNDIGYPRGEYSSYRYYYQTR